jgi:PBP1b-binding outer membrane lipoprotein LpoB
MKYAILLCALALTTCSNGNKAVTTTTPITTTPIKQTPCLKYSKPVNTESGLISTCLKRG